MRIAIVGTGPTGIYALKHLIEGGKVAEVHLFERGEEAGIGLPYSSENVITSMLANIASIEIPSIVETYLDWLGGLPAGVLQSYGVEPAKLDNRRFTPRLLLGLYFRDQLLALVDRAAAAGVLVEVRECTEVSDIIPQDGLLALSITDRSDAGPFDRVILATGHEFPEADEATRSYYPSPWSGLIQARVPAVRVGVLGTSLSGIDAVMAVANQHGKFVLLEDGLTFETTATGLHLTMMSWTGVLPEADFYCPIPYEPLTIMTDAAVADCTRKSAPLDAVFDLFSAEITAADPTYAARIALSGLTADTFSPAYFAAREAQDPFRWARKNLEEVEHNKAHKITVPWRYAILRMHEKVEEIVQGLPESDRERFDKGLKKVFVDNYAAVPSESIRRLLALREAGVLSVLALGDDYDLKRDAQGTKVTANGAVHDFDVFIDARGQKPLASSDLRFPTLRRALLDADQETPEVGDDYSLLDIPAYAGLVMAAIPYLMHDRPFVQGITASADIGQALARGMVTTRRRRRWA